MHEKVDTFIKANNIGGEELFSFLMFFAFTLDGSSERQGKTK